MAKITSAPSAPRFANVWTRGFANAVRNAAGQNERLSLNEAKQIAKTKGAEALFSDNAVNYLDAVDQQSVSVEKLIAAGHKYVEDRGRSVAGQDGRISFKDAQDLPQDLRAEYQYLRGKDLSELLPGGNRRETNLEKMATKFVNQNQGANRAFPKLADAYDGADAYMLTGDVAKRAVDFLKEMRSPLRYDPSKHVLIAVTFNQDEPNTHFALMDKRTGKSAGKTHVAMVDARDGLSEAAYARLFPGLTKGDAEAEDLQDGLLDKGTALAIAN